MPAEALTIKDPSFRIRNPKTEQMMKEHEAENLARAEAKEKERLEKEGLIDAFLNGIDKISKLFSKKKKKEIEMLQQKKNSKEK